MKFKTLEQKADWRYFEGIYSLIFDDLSFIESVYLRYILRYGFSNLLSTQVSVYPERKKPVFV